MLKPHHRMYLAGFVLDAAAMVTMTVLPFFVFRQLGGGVAMSGIIGAAYMMAYALTALVSSGFVSRADNGLHWAIGGVLLATVSFCLIPAFRQPVVCGTLAAVTCVGNAFVWPALHSWIGAEPDLKKRSHRMGRFNVAWSAGFAVSALVAGALCDLNYLYPFVLLFVLNAIGIALLFSLPHERAHFGQPTSAALEARAGHDRASDVHLYTAWFANFATVAFVAVTRTVFPKRIVELVDAGQLRLLFEAEPAQFLTTAAATKYSWLSFALTGTCAAVFLVLSRTHRWRHRFSYLAAIQAASAAAFWVLSDTRSLVVMMACFVVLGINNGLTFFAAVYYSVANPEHKHGRAAINEAAVGFGAFTGSMAFGLLAARYGMAFPFRYAPLLVAAALAVQVGLLRYGARRHAQ